MKLVLFNPLARTPLGRRDQSSIRRVLSSSTLCSNSSWSKRRVANSKSLVLFNPFARTPLGRRDESPIRKIWTSSTLLLELLLVEGTRLQFEKFGPPQPSCSNSSWSNRRVVNSKSLALFNSLARTPLGRRDTSPIRKVWSSSSLCSNSSWSKRQVVNSKSLVLFNPLARTHLGRADKSPIRKVWPSSTLLLLVQQTSHLDVNEILKFYLLNNKTCLISLETTATSKSL